MAFEQATYTFAIMSNICVSAKLVCYNNTCFLTLHGLEHSLEFLVGGLLLLGGVVILFHRCLPISLRYNEPSFNSQEGG